MSITRIFTEPFEILNIVTCRIHMEVNEHFSAVVEGYVQLEEEGYLEDMMSQTFVIKAYAEDEVMDLFRGNINDILLNGEGGLNRIVVSAKSKTVMLDSEKHFRTFHGIGQTFRQITDAVLSFTRDVSTIHPKGRGICSDGLIVQYWETDWEFLKRLASQLNTVLVADCTNDSICFYFGNPDRRNGEHLDMKGHRMRRYIGFGGTEAVEYVVSSYKKFKLCDQVFIGGEPYYVYKIKSSYHKKELVFEYTFRTSGEFKTTPVRCEKIKGISINGEVTDVRETEVRVRLSSEADFDFGSSLWFPYSTVYSSPDGTGWYCMPEKGDSIRLHIPGSKEQSAFVISAVHMDNDSSLRENPDEKSIRTKYNKEIRLTPQRILITNNHGMSIILDDNEGILIKSNKKIEVVSEAGIELKGGQVNMEGKKGVLLMEGPNMIMVRDGIKEQGMNIEHR